MSDSPSFREARQSWDTNITYVYVEGHDLKGRIEQVDPGVWEAAVGNERLGRWFSYEKAADAVKKKLADHIRD